MIKFDVGLKICWGNGDFFSETVLLKLSSSFATNYHFFQINEIILGPINSTVRQGTFKPLDKEERDIDGQSSMNVHVPQYLPAYEQELRCYVDIPVLVIDLEFG